MTALIVLMIVAGVLLVWVVLKFNSLVTLRNQVKNGWSQIDVQLKRRHDLIPNLVNTVKGYMEFEQDTLRQVIEARNAAVSAQGVADAGLKEGELSAALTRLFALVENYPNLKANQNVAQLQEELTSTENKVSFARQGYNDAVMGYNTSRESFPDNIFANLFSFGPAELLQATESAEERKAPQVKF